MIKKTPALILLLVVSLIGNSQQVLPVSKIYEELSKSIVSVEVKPVPDGINTCTGFIWQKPDQIITSLHAMHPGAKIFVKYFNDLRYLREVEPIKVYKDADLVLLKIKKGQNPPPPVEPITADQININRLDAEETIYSLGYPSGARVASSKVLKKGYINKPPPETLESFLPKAYVDILRNHEFPKINIEIIYVQGSLLPGYSGAPCVDARGKLVGIGDGGLEKGAANVSWLIPVKFLSTLEKSTETELPQALATSLHFCSTLPYTAGIEDPLADTNIAEKSIYDPIISDDFEFYLLKNRSLQEMYESSGNDYNLIRILEQFKFEFNVNIDPRDLRFDVYEDIKNGVVIAIPEGEKLYYHKDDNHFQVDSSETKDVNILFNGLTGDFANLSIERELDLTYRWLLDSMQVYWNVKEFTIDEDFTRIYNMYDNPDITYDDNRKVANVLMSSEPIMDAELGGLCTVYLYVTMIMSPEKSFMSVASYKISNDRVNKAKTERVDCYDSASLEKDCQYFQTFIKAFCSAHLTTFAF